MLSYQITAYGEPLVPVTSETPQPRGTEVLLRIRTSGVCHSDLHYWQGGYEIGAGRKFTLEERGVRLPIVPGHEPLGEVEAVGPDAGDVPVGGIRAVFPWVGCGACPRCEAGRDIDCDHLRTIGLFSPGGYSTHVLVPHPRYLFDVSGIPPAHACTLGCAGITALGALRKTGPLDPGDAVVLIGAGGVGLTAVGLGREVLERPMIVVDTVAAKLAAARESGATHVVDSSLGDPKEAVLDLAGGQAGAVIDFVGTAQTLSLGMSLVRRGGKLVLVGLYGGSWRLPIPMIPLRNVALVGSLTGTLRDMHEVIELVRRGGTVPVPVETRRLDRVNETLEDLRAGRIVGRVVLEP